MDAKESRVLVNSDWSIAYKVREELKMESNEKYLRRERFVMAAMQGLLARVCPYAKCTDENDEVYSLENAREEFAWDAIAIADTVLKELDKEE